MCTRDELFTYMKDVFGVAPQPLENVSAFREMVARHRAKESVQRELLAAIAPILGELAERYQTPGEAVSDFWLALERMKDTPKDIGAALRNWRRYEKTSEQRRANTEGSYREAFGNETSSVEEALPLWFWRLPEEHQRILWGIIVGEEDWEVALDTSTTEEGAKKRRQRLLKDLQKKVVPPTPDDSSPSEQEEKRKKEKKFVPKIPGDAPPNKKKG